MLRLSCACSVPQGMGGGMPLQVQTPAGLMQVTIPNGLSAGASFEMMVPQAQQAPQVAQAMPVSQPQQQMYQQQPPQQQMYQQQRPQQQMYQQQQPQQQIYQQQPQVQVMQQAPPTVVVQQQPQVVHVGGPPVIMGGYGGYGYDPGLGMMGGFVGGMIAGEMMDEVFD